MNRAEKRRQKKLAEKATRNSQRVPSLSPLLEQSAQTIEQSLSLASQHLIGGRSAQAKSIYQQILQSDPEQPVALHFLGVIAHQRGNNTLAVERITRALVIKPDYAEAHNNLGTVFKDLGRLEEAVASHQKSIAINPDNANAHFNFGNVLREMGRLDEAVECYNKTVAIKPDYVEAHCNLGIALQNLGNFDEAEAKYQSTLAIAPGFAKAHYNLGTLLQQIGRFDEAISSYDLSALDYSRINSLECLYALERYEDFYLNLDKFIETDSKSVHAAAISTFASHQLNRTNPYPFCKNPMDFVRVYDDLIGPDEDEFLQRLVYELKSRETIWEPNGKTTHNGYQSLGNLFSNSTGLLADLECKIKDKIENFRSEFISEDCELIKSMPNELSIYGWFVRLLNGGHQTEHIHPSGWISGVFYVQVPEYSDQSEGSIELGLRGYKYPILDNSYPRKCYFPKYGDLVLFPSSLFHRTIPFHSNEERICVAFDLIPTNIGITRLPDV